jgi:hypothetical protein
MSLTETSKLLEQSGTIVQDSDSNDVSVMLTSILSLVSTIDNRLQRVEKGLCQFDGLKNMLASLTSRLVTVEKDVKTCCAKVTELEGNIQGVSNLFDNLKVEFKKKIKIKSRKSPKFAIKTKMILKRCQQNLSQPRQISVEIHVPVKKTLRA